MKATLDYCTVAFSPFQYHQLRIIEFPRYGTFAESFPNTIPYSESIGFIEKVDPNKPDSIDCPFSSRRTKWVTSGGATRW
jgi:ABC-2 type transport system permease protein